MLFALAGATLMLTVVGAIIAILLRSISVDSWRLRSWLIAAVLLQGLMLYRAPIHLDWGGPIASSPDPSGTFSARAEPSKLRWRESFSTTEEPTISTLQDTSLNRSPAVAVPKIPWSIVLPSIWLVVLLGLIGIACTRYMRLLMLLRRIDRAPHRWQQQWQAVLDQSSRRGCGRGAEMLVSETVGPLLVRRPTGYALIVPESYWRQLDPSQRLGVMLHELSHLRRRDVWRQLAARAIAAVHWFNPVAWWALRQYEHAAELACDHLVARQGKAAAAGFASALVELVQWHDRRGASSQLSRGVGFQAMAAPPLSHRIHRLLKTSSHGDSLMKRIVLASVAIALVAASFFQVRFTPAQDSQEPSQQQVALKVIDEDLSLELFEITENLDTSDPTTQRLASLTESVEGKIALVGILNQLSSAARDEARADALPRFVRAHFDRSQEGKLAIRDLHGGAIERWKVQSKRLSENMAKLSATTEELSSRIDTSTETGGLFQRLLKDKQVPAAILLFEMEGGGDVITRFVADALDQILVERADGKFEVVPSRRSEAEKHVERFEMAGKVAEKLRRQVPIWAEEIDDSDSQHRQLVSYMNNPLMATVVALHITKDNDVRSPAAAVNALFEQLEETADETAGGLRINNDKTWEKFQEIFRQVDRASEMTPRVQQRLLELAETLSTSDPLVQRFAAQLREAPIAVLMAVELPYAEADPGEELRAMLDEVLAETSDNKLKIVPQREAEVGQKAKELLRVCRAIRRHVADVDQMLSQLDDQKFVAEIGDAGRYLMLSEVHKFAERHRPHPIDLLKEKLLVETDSGKLRVQPQRRDVIRRLIEQSEKVRQEAANDDF